MRAVGVPLSRYHDVGKAYVLEEKLNPWAGDHLYHPPEVTKHDEKPHDILLLDRMRFGDIAVFHSKYTFHGALANVSEDRSRESVEVKGGFVQWV
jgi:hypothetical protein